jgi:putative sterol carrier protein
MSITETGGLKMALYPSQAWCDEWKKALNNTPAVQETGKNWGVEFNGNWVFQVEPGDGLDKTTYVYLEASAGQCTKLQLVDDPEEVNPGFYAAGLYADFKPVVKGEKDFIEGVVKGTFKLKGDMSKIMRHAKFIRAVANSISSFESEYLGE